MIIYNKKAKFNYDISEEYCSGIQLLSSEVKSICINGGSFNDSFCIIHNNEVFIRNFYIPKYKHSTYNNHEELRERKLLLTKKEIKDLHKYMDTPGFSIVPIGIISKNGKFKLIIGVGKGKKLWNKKEDKKEADIKREISKELNLKY
jgi:SsrA-binding protein